MAEKVFAVTEQLEAVLLQLPMKDLLFAQKVCKRWQTVIRASDPVQKALFLKPGVAADAPKDAITSLTPLMRDVPTGGIAINPLFSTNVTDTWSSIQEKGRKFDIAPSALKAGHGNESCFEMHLTQPSIKLHAEFEYECTYTGYHSSITKVEEGGTLLNLIQRMDEAPRGTECGEETNGGDNIDALDELDTYEWAELSFY